MTPENVRLAEIGLRRAAAKFAEHLNVSPIDQTDSVGRRLNKKLLRAADIYAKAKEMSVVNFNISQEDRRHIDAIVDRAMEMWARQNAPRDRMAVEMDIVACHANGTPLRLEELASADAFNFAHDVMGIARFLDRDTGKLTGHFSPRYSAAVQP